jgi:hypothetical protein
LKSYLHPRQRSEGLWFKASPWQIVREILYQKYSTGHPWITPIILATQEAEIRKIKVQSAGK